jgi:glucose-6-phosphate 1-dehydrogenase
MITRLLLLGATGDLAGRFLLPALATLRATGALPAPVQVVGAGEQHWDDARFRAHVADRLREHAGDVPAADRAALLDAVRYRRVDLADPSGIADALGAFDVPAGHDAGGVAVYLALPPRWFPAALRALAGVGLPSGSRVAVEKPFGQDLAGAVELNALLDDLGDGTAASAFRVDHILGMPRVEDLQRLRAPGGPLEPVWDAAHVEEVAVLWEEILGLGTRTDFYDRTGAVRDVLQNHMLQVLALVVMEPPATSSREDLHRAKAAALRAVGVPSADQVASRTRRARYTAGTLVAPDGAPLGEVVGYAEADGVDPARGTETHAELVLEVDTPRWSGTRFVLRTGKALSANRKGVALRLRPGVAAPPDAAGDVDRTADGALWIELDGPRRSAGRPDVQVNAPGELSAYGRVLTEVLTGGGRTSVSAEEAEVSWRIVDPVLRAWAAGAVPLEEYAAGSAGPPTLG